MLGKQHLLLSTGTVLPFLIPLVFLENNLPLLYAIVFYLAVMVGSLTPDADCGGKSKLHYDFPYVYIAMKFLKVVVSKNFVQVAVVANMHVNLQVEEKK